MSYLRFVCLLASTLTTAAVLLAVAQSQALQRGVSVELAVTNNAAPMPDADKQDAWIVTVTDDGSLYFGVDPVTRDGLVGVMIRTPRNREQKLYIKADARANYGDVEYALRAAQVAEFEAPVLVTAQFLPLASGGVQPPNGLEVLVDTALPAGTVATVVELFSSRQQPLILKINNDQIPWSALQSTLTQHFQKGDEKVILLKADVHLPFADVVHAIDVCRSTGARVYMGTPRGM
jgi:biopolymer transport protein ExbD